ncbi:MAG: OmpH family outer membrane protein [Rhodospirillaceae bacterium]|nr:OmpH family outer membrane protein [Rhodospirillaceae bacterium]
MASMLSLVIVAGFSGHAVAQTSTAQGASEPKGVFIKVGIIDIEGVRANSAAIKNIRAQIDKYRSAIQADIQNEEVALRKANEELARQRTILAPEAFNAERMKFEQKLAALQKKVQGSKQALGIVQAEAVKKVDQAILEAIQEVIQKENYTLILRKSSTVAAANALDLSQRMLAVVNKKLPNVKVADPSTRK